MGVEQRPKPLEEKGKVQTTSRLNNGHYLRGDGTKIRVISGVPYVVRSAEDYLRATSQVESDALDYLQGLTDRRPIRFNR